MLLASPQDYPVRVRRLRELGSRPVLPDAREGSGKAAGSPSPEGVPPGGPNASVSGPRTTRRRRRAWSRRLRLMPGRRRGGVTAVTGAGLLAAAVASRNVPVSLLPLPWPLRRGRSTLRGLTQKAVTGTQPIRLAGDGPASTVPSHGRCRRQAAQWRPDGTGVTMTAGVAYAEPRTTPTRSRPSTRGTR